MLFGWNEKIPPRQTWVAASWSVLEPLQVVKTCKQGCCVIHPMFGSMTLPKYYRLATEAEIAKATKPVNKPVKQVNPFSEGNDL